MNIYSSKTFVMIKYDRLWIKYADILCKMCNYWHIFGAVDCGLWVGDRGEGTIQGNGGSNS